MAVRVVPPKRRITLRCIAVSVVAVVVYLSCFNAIHKSGLAFSTENLWNATYDQVFFLPTVLDKQSRHDFYNVTMQHSSIENPGLNQQHQSQIIAQEHVAVSSTVMTTTNIPKLEVIPKPNPFPPQDDIMNWIKNASNRTAGNFMLDFVIIGFAKCGTSTMMVWLGQQEGFHVPRDELTVLKKQEPWDLVERLYQPQTRDPLFGKDSSVPISFRGYKSPNEIDDIRPMRLLREFFPKTKLILGMRHPVLMMESFYNFRVQNGFPIVPFEKISFGNFKDSFSVHWGRAEYPGMMLHLGKTDLNTTKEIELLPKRQQDNILKKGVKFPRNPNPVFLYDVHQMKEEKGNNNLELFIQGLANFLGLTQELTPIIHEQPGRPLSPEVQAERDAKKIDICDPKHNTQKEFLLDIGKKSADWILNYFVHGPDVYVANPDQFRRLVESYGKDPCDARVSKNKTLKTTSV